MSIHKCVYAGAALLLVLTTGACGKGEDGAAASSMSSDMPTKDSMAQAPAVAKSEMPNESKGLPSDTAYAGASSGSVSRQGFLSGNQARNPQPQLASFVTQRSVIRNAQMAVRVENVEKAEKLVDKYTESIGGYVDAAQSADLASENPTIDITLRIPVQRFDEALATFEGYGVRLSKTVNSEDVTGQIVDLDARLKTLAAQEDTYRKLLRSMTSLNNVITLQDKLTEVRGEIESMAAQRKSLGGLAALSTVNVHLQQSAAPVAPPTDPNWLAQVWGQSTTTFGAIGRNLASFGIWFAVFSPIWAPILFVLWRLGRPRVRPEVGV